MLGNIQTLTDGYKPTHPVMYPPELAWMQSYNEARGGEYPATTFFGLQYILKRYMVGHTVTMAGINEADDLMAEYYGRRGVYPRERWEHIYNDHLGCLPLNIRAVDEGARYPLHTPLYTIDNSCRQCVWLNTYIDSLLMHTWLPNNVGTISSAGYDVIMDNLVRTGTPEDIKFKLHDFGFRGAAGPEAAALGGAAHLLRFRGTDTLVALEMARDYYHAKTAAGNSIPASEHSTIMAWGKMREFDAYKRIIEQYPTGFVACVSDTYDIENAISKGWGGSLRQMVLDRDGTLVVRPDSGEPAQVVLDTVRQLAAAFGTTKNNKGFLVLNPHVRVIQGDGIDIPTIKNILRVLEMFGWSGDNIAFGMGGALLQKHNRDTSQYATKPCYGMYANGEEFLMEKTPVGDPSKWSQSGMKHVGKLVYQNGYMVREWTWDEVVANAGS